MFCKACGKEIDQDSKFCSICGKEISKTRVKGNPQTEDYKNGVGGWLLFFIITIFISILMSSISVYGLNLEQTGYSSYDSYIVFISIITVILMLFGIYVIYSLFKRKNSAISLAKKYLIFRVILPVITFATFGLFAASSIPSDMASEEYQGIILSGVGGIIYVIIWYLYLSKSKRVNATYNSEITLKKGDKMTTKKEKINENEEEILKLKKKYRIVLIFAIIFLVEVVSRFVIGNSFNSSTASEGVGVITLIFVYLGISQIGALFNITAYIGLLITGLWAFDLNSKIKRLTRENTKEQ